MNELFSLKIAIYGASAICRQDSLLFFFFFFFKSVHHTQGRSHSSSDWLYYVEKAYDYSILSPF